MKFAIKYITCGEPGIRSLRPWWPFTTFNEVNMKLAMLTRINPHNFYWVEPITEPVWEDFEVQ